MQPERVARVILGLAMASTAVGAICNGDRRPADTTLLSSGDVTLDSGRMRSLTFDADSFMLDSSGALIARRAPLASRPGTTVAPERPEPVVRADEQDDGDRGARADDGDARPRKWKGHGRGKGRGKGRGHH